MDALYGVLIFVCAGRVGRAQARLAQSVERKALNLVVVGSSPTVGDHFLFIFCSSLRFQLHPLVS